MYVCMYVCMHVCMYVCMCVYIHIYIYIYMHNSTKYLQVPVPILAGEASRPGLRGDARQPGLARVVVLVPHSIINLFYVFL